MNEPNPAEQRPIGGQPGAGLGVGEEQLYQDGFKVGDVVHRFGTRDSVTRDRPGWYIADGTQPDLIIDGVSYGKPDLTKRVIMGADGSAGFDSGDTGGSSAHVHPFTHESAHAITQPTAHGITQPVFDAPAAHVVSGPTIADHTDHKHGTPFAKAVGGTGQLYMLPSSTYGIGPSLASESVSAAPTGTGGTVVGTEMTGTPLTTVGAALTLTHTVSAVPTLTNNHAAPNRSTDVALTHNHDGVALSNNSPHAGGSVDAATGDNRYPSYVAVWPLLKVF